MGLLRVRAAMLLALAAVMTAAVSPGAKVRLRVIGLKIVGELPEVSKWDMLPLLKPGAGFDLPALVHTRSPFAALQLPRPFQAESASGGTVFARRCASCHGPRAEGGIGPSLVRGDLLHGASDWAISARCATGYPAPPCGRWASRSTTRGG